MQDKFIIQKHVNMALEEDLPFGDITTDSLTPENEELICFLNTRADGIFCGKDVFETVFKTLDEKVKVNFFKNDGDEIKKGEKIAEIKGNARAILKGERTALNYVQRMSGIATETNKYAKKLENYKARISDTRKTTPNFRYFEKYAVQVGGGTVHRFNLSDCVMIKDNHIKAAGSLTTAVERVKKVISHTHKIEVECDNLNQVKEAVNCGVDIILLDNMNYETMTEAVKIIDNKAVSEASGNVKYENLEEIAKTGVDIISTSAIVAGAKTLDLGLDID